MATWLEKSRSPEYSPAKLSQMLAEVEAVIGISELDEAMAHETIIAGGYLNTHLIKAKSIKADHIGVGEIKADHIAADTITSDKISVDSLSAISANLGTITAGTINGVTINGSTFNVTAQSGDDYGLTIRRGLIEAKDSDSKILFRLGGLTNNLYTGYSYRGGLISADSIISFCTDQSTGNTGIDITKNSGVQIWGGKLNAQNHIGNFACGSVILNTDTWKRVTFNDGANPIVFRAAPIVVLTSQDGVNSISNGKVRNVTTTGFEAILGGSGYPSSTHGYIAYCPFGEVF